MVKGLILILTFIICLMVFPDNSFAKQENKSSYYYTEEGNLIQLAHQSYEREPAMSNDGENKTSNKE